jgi:putative ABC transport system ATP-binding protein
VIQLDNIDVIFDAGTPLEQRALQDVCLRMPKGQFVTLIGANGSGKSTILNLIAGTIQPNRGTIAVAGRDVTGWPVHARAKLVSRVFQDPKVGTCENLTILENFAVARNRTVPRGLRFAVDRNLRKETARRLQILKLDLENRLDDKVGQLSGGQRQALSLLMATSSEASVLLLDEPASALDPEIGKRVNDLTQTIAAALSLTVIMVTHSMAEALCYGDRTLMLNRGRIALDICGAERTAIEAADLLHLFKRDVSFGSQFPAD